MNTDIKKFYEGLDGFAGGGINGAYIPYGAKWVKDMMKFSKPELIAQLIVALQSKNVSAQPADIEGKPEKQFTDNEILKMGDNILTELKKNPASITHLLNKDENTSYNTGFHKGFDLGFNTGIKNQPNKVEDIEGRTQEENDLIIAGIEEGSEQWKAEYDNCRAILMELVDLKNIKDSLSEETDKASNFSLSLNYSSRKPLAWAAAKKFLEKYQHQ